MTPLQNTTLCLFLTIGTTLFAQDKDISHPKPFINVDKNITSLVKTKFNNNYGDNYKIQLYYGNLDKSHSVLSKFNSKFSEWTGKIEYETPNYKVWIGNYRTRLEADRALLKISKSFPNAFIFKPNKK